MDHLDRCQWSESPGQYSIPSTCCRRLTQWEETGVLLKLWRAFLAQPNDQQKLRWNECFADGSFIPAKKGPQSRQDQAGQWHEVDGSGRGAGTPVGACLDAATPAEATLLEQTFDTVAVGRPGKPGPPCKQPARLIADRAYDSNPLRARLVRRAIGPTIPAPASHKRATHPDRRKLRRYRRRWTIEHTFAWLEHCRWPVAYYKRFITVYAGFFHLACALLTLCKVLK
ncbi:MAG: IS5 family transposase [Candidatus Entotheonellia bacterium]